VLAALQKIDAAAAEAGYPRGRYLFVETRSPGEPDLEVEFTFESYAEMERLERAMRERMARFLREGGAAGQEHLLEPSATKHLLLVEAGAAVKTAAASPAPTTRSAPAPAPVSAPVPVGPPDLTLEEDEGEGEFEAPPEPEVPPPPAPPPGVTAEQFRRGQLDRARAALQSAERAVGAGKLHGGGDAALGVQRTRDTGQTPRHPPKSA
jgi:hypothetical protein